MTVIATVTTPILSNELRETLDKMDFWTNRKPKALVDEARKILPQLQAFLAPSSQEKLSKEIWKFAEVLNAGVANPLSGEALEVRCVAVEIACDGLPEICWSRETYRAALKRFKFFPSASEIVGLLEEQCASAKKYRDLVGYFLRSEEVMAANERKEGEKNLQFEARWEKEKYSLQEADVPCAPVIRPASAVFSAADNIDARIADAERELEVAHGSWRGVMQQYLNALRSQKQLNTVQS